jgi:hypothetical protein
MFSKRVSVLMLGLGLLASPMHASTATTSTADTATVPAPVATLAGFSLPVDLLIGQVVTSQLQGTKLKKDRKTTLIVAGMIAAAVAVYVIYALRHPKGGITIH